MLAVAALVAGIAAATTAADYVPQIAKATQNAANSLIPSDFRNSDTARDLHRALAA